MDIRDKSPHFVLALSFEPEAIREHFEGDDDHYGDLVVELTDEQLREVAGNALLDDVLYDAFHQSLMRALDLYACTHARPVPNPPDVYARARARMYARITPEETG